MLAQMIRMSQNKNRVAQAAILAMEIVLLPTGLISTLLILKDSTNPFCFFHSLFCNLRDHCLRFKLSLLSSPFFICLFINSIVILILLSSSSKFHHRRIEPYDLFSYDSGDIPAAPPSPAGTVPFESGTDNFTKQSQTTMGTNKTGPIFLEDDQDIISGRVDDVKEHHQNREIEINDDEDTIEATWEAIGGGGAEEKQSSELKKSDTWPRPPPVVPPATATWKELRKSVTFNDAVSACRRGGLARDVLRSPEEMNKRFDDFIQKVNHQLRLQRQESDQRFLETFNRGR